MSNETIDIYTCYAICPYAGVICKKCNKQVIPDEKYGFSKGILKHELNANKNSSDRHNHTKRNVDVKIRKDFQELVTTTFKEIARKLVLGNVDTTDHDAYRQNILSHYLQSRQKYFSCTDSQCIGKLFIDKRKHQIHYSLCKETYGYVPKYWTKGNPKPIVDPFDINVKDNFCLEFWKILQETKQELHRQQQQNISGSIQLCNPIVTTTTTTNTNSTLLNLLLEKEKEMDIINTDIDIQCQPAKETNTWLRRVGWDRHFDENPSQPTFLCQSPLQDNDDINLSHEKGKDNIISFDNDTCFQEFFKIKYDLMRNLLNVYVLVAPYDTKQMLQKYHLTSKFSDDAIKEIFFKTFPFNSFALRDDTIVPGNDNVCSVRDILYPLHQEQYKIAERINAEVKEMQEKLNASEKAKTWLNFQQMDQVQKAIRCCFHYIRSYDAKHLGSDGGTDDMFTRSYS
jgi:hypothetical protein